jgi:hypothetical protein
MGELGDWMLQGNGHVMSFRIKPTDMKRTTRTPLYNVRF